jgi:enamine deaminase RidA (YjgF/YER057c/UK114 family)
MHRGVEYGGVLYIGGVGADDRSQDVSGQMAQITRKIDALLAQHGSSKEKLLTATVFMTNLANKEAMNTVWTTWLDKDNLPARATVGVADLGAGLLVEVVATAAVN